VAKYHGHPLLTFLHSQEEFFHPGLIQETPAFAA